MEIFGGIRGCGALRSVDRALVPGVLSTAIVRCLDTSLTRISSSDGIELPLTAGEIIGWDESSSREPKCSSSCKNEMGLGLTKVGTASGEARRAGGEGGELTGAIVGRARTLVINRARRSNCFVLCSLRVTSRRRSWCFFAFRSRVACKRAWKRWLSRPSLYSKLSSSGEEHDLRGEEGGGVNSLGLYAS